MLSSVLHSNKAIQVNIQIIRVFTKIRQTLLDASELRLSIEHVLKKTENNSKNIELIFQYLDELMEKKDKEVSRSSIGYIKN